MSHDSHTSALCLRCTVTARSYASVGLSERHKLGIEKDLLQRAINRKLRLFGHVCRMEDDTKLKMLVFGIVEGTNKRGRPCRGWTDAIVTWC